MSEHDHLVSEIIGRFGLQPRASWATDLKSAIQRLCSHHRLTAEQLLARASGNGILQRELAGHLTVEESYFFRNRPHFDILAGFVAERLADQQLRPRLTIWCAGCARGEEPYSVAMTIREQLGQATLDRVDIMASDLNGKAIAIAEQGVYSPWSLRDVPAATIKRYFTDLGSKKFKVKPEIQRAVAFHHLALQEHLALLQPGSVDVILFRNVAIYLEPSALSSLYEGFARIIRDDGLLIIAPTDTRPPAKIFAPASGSASVLARCRPPVAAEAHRPARKRVRSTGSDRVRPRAETRALRPKPHPQQQVPAPSAAQALALGNQGRYDEALQVADRIIECGPAETSGYLLRGKISLSANRFEQAVSDFRRALFLDPEALVGRYWYALALNLAGRPRQSQIQIRSLTRTLEMTPSDAVLEDGKTTAGELLRAADFWQKSFA